MNDISFTVESCPEREHLCFVNIDVDGAPMPRSLFNAAEVLGALGFDGVDVDLFTCDCGVPGCAGYSPLEQIVRDHEVEWFFPTGSGYPHAGSSLVFDRSRFESSLLSLQENLLSLESGGRYLSTQIERAFEDDDADESGLAPVIQATPLLDTVAWYRGRFEADSRGSAVVRAYSALSDDRFRIRWGLEVTPYELSPSDIVWSLMNESPSDASPPFFWRRLAHASLSLGEFVRTGATSGLERVLYKGYPSPSLDPRDFLMRYFNVPAEFPKGAAFLEDLTFERV